MSIISIICYFITVIKFIVSCTLTAFPELRFSAISFIPSTIPKSTDPPELILSFNVYVAPPTYVMCQVDGTTMDVSSLSREVTAGEYLPPNTTSPVTNVTVILRTRQAGNYQCNVSVFRSSGENLINATQQINIAG